MSIIDARSWNPLLARPFHDSSHRAKHSDEYQLRMHTMLTIESPDEFDRVRLLCCNSRRTIKHVLAPRLSFSIRLLASAWLISVLPLAAAVGCAPLNAGPKFNVIALAEANSIHRPFVNAAKIWLQKQAGEDNFSIDYIENT